MNAEKRGEKGTDEKGRGIRGLLVCCDELSGRGEVESRSNLLDRLHILM